MVRIVAEHQLAERAPSLDLRDVTVSFGAFTAVDNVSLAVRPGEIVGLIGPNGAGKSTLIGTVTGEVSPTSGFVYLGGEDISRRSPFRRARRGLGWTFQNLELFTSLTVIENVAVHVDNCSPRGSGLSAVRRRRNSTDQAHEALQSIGIADLADRPVGDLSYGERKLVEFARSTSVALDVLLLDEPLAGVAVQERGKLIEVIAGFLEKSDLAVLIVEHDMRAIKGVCSLVNVMVSGKVIARGAFAEVVEDTMVRDAYLGSFAS